MDAKQAPLTAAELDALEKTAKAATQGRWLTMYNHTSVFKKIRNRPVRIAQCWTDDFETPQEPEANAAHIASCDPPTVRRLLAQARRALAAEKLLAQFLEAVDDAWRDDNDPGEIMIDGSWVDATRALLGGPYDDDDAALSAAGTPAGQGER